MRSVNARRFRDARHLCVLSQQATADLLRVSLRTVKNWESGNFRVPYAAYKLMRILRGYQLPGESWRGWNLKGDTLWSPEGRPFRASDHSWWSLLVSKAAAFDRIVGERGGAGRVVVRWEYPADSSGKGVGLGLSETGSSKARHDAVSGPEAAGLVYSETSGHKTSGFGVNASFPGGSTLPPDAGFAAVRVPAGAYYPDKKILRQVTGSGLGGAE